MRCQACIFAVFVLLLRVGGLHAEEHEQGALLFSECMFNPSGPKGGLEQWSGSWFEIFNAGAEPVALDGLIVKDFRGSALKGWVFKGRILPAGEFMVLAETKESAMAQGVEPAFVYGSALLLELSMGRLEIWLDGSVQDVFQWNGLNWKPPKPGDSFSLEPSALNTDDNDDSRHWCSGPPNPGKAGQYCDGDGDGYTEVQGDCDDEDPLKGPGNNEKCNGLDDDCNGLIDDGLIPPFSCLKEGVCAGIVPSCLPESGWACVYPDTFEKQETLCDLLDNDCDGLVDETLTNSCGVCGEPPLDLCNGLDDDCDGSTDEDDVRPDASTLCIVNRTGVCVSADVACGVEGWHCVLPPGYEPEELTCDGLDNDCDGLTDDGWPVGTSCEAGEGLCRLKGVWGCNEAGTDVHCVTEPIDGAVELCGNGRDDDCDGQTDEGFLVGETCSQGEGLCKTTGKWVCSPDGQGEMCSAQPGFPDMEFCDGLDNDCDGATDEDGCEPDEAGQATCASAPTRAGPAAIAALLLLAVLFSALLRGRRRS